MPQQYLGSLAYWSIPVFLFISGCAAEMRSPEARMRTPQPTRLDWTVENRLTARSRSEGASHVASGGGNLSSLDALRRGESTETAPSTPLQDIYFDFDRYELRADARATLDRNSRWLKEHPSVRVQIEGHCDERGSNEYNMALAAKRAEAARDYLVSSGIAAHRLSTVSYGEEVPLCTEHTESCWKRNRRSRFVILFKTPSS